MSRQLRLDILDKINNNGEGVDVFRVSRQPYTYVSIVFTDEHKGLSRVTIGHGFSKVMYPDVFDYDIGVNIATAKAVQDVVDQIT